MVDEVSLLTYLERIIAERDRQYAERFRSQELALIKAETALSEYKVSANEWRGLASDLTARFPTRAEASAQAGSVEDRLRGEIVNIRTGLDAAQEALGKRLDFEQSQITTLRDAGNEARGRDRVLAVGFSLVAAAAASGMTAIIVRLLGQ